MKDVTCPFEAEVLDAIQSARWPDRIDPSLAAHVKGCAVCRDVAPVALAVLGASDVGATRRLPDAAAVWLRAQLRARAEAQRLAAQSITMAQAGVLAFGATLIGVILGASLGRLRAHATGFAAHLHQWLVSAVAPGAVVAILDSHLSLVLGALTAVVLTPVAAYLLVRE